jgi:hypothetical protein
MFDNNTGNHGNNTVISEKEFEDSQAVEEENSSLNVSNRFSQKLSILDEETSLAIGMKQSSDMNNVDEGYSQYEGRNSMPSEQLQQSSERKKTTNTTFDD